MLQQTTHLARAVYQLRMINRLILVCAVLSSLLLCLGSLELSGISHFYSALKNPQDSHTLSITGVVAGALFAMMVVFLLIRAHRQELAILLAQQDYAELSQQMDLNKGQLQMLLRQNQELEANKINWKKAEERLRTTESLFHESIDTLDAAFVIYDETDHLVWCNQKFRNLQPNGSWGADHEDESEKFFLYGRTFEEVLRLRLAHGQYPVPPEQQEQWIAERLIERKQSKNVVEREFGNGQWVRITDQRTPSGYLVGLRVDVTELYHAKHAAEVAQRNIEEKNRELELIALHDSLTKLPNRSLLNELLEQTISQSLRRGQLVAVVFIDLDGFKIINDTYGHQAGDYVLIKLAERMKEALRDGDVLSRLGGDEFVAVLPDLVEIDASSPILNRLLRAVAEPVQYGQAALQLSASMGVTFYPPAQQNLTQPLKAHQLLRQADQALYRAKKEGKNRFHIFDPILDTDARELHDGM